MQQLQLSLMINCLESAFGLGMGGGMGPRGPMGGPPRMGGPPGMWGPSDGPPGPPGASIGPQPPPSIGPTRPLFPAATSQVSKTILSSHNNSRYSI